MAYAIVNGKKVGNDVVLPSAKTTTYDNETSGLSATTAQAAIDEVNSKADKAATTIGTTDISAIGDGTLTGAVTSVNENLSEFEKMFNAQLWTGNGTLTITLNEWATDKSYLILFGNGNGYFGVSVLQVSSISYSGSLPYSNLGSDLITSASQNGKVLTVNTRSYGVIGIFAPMGIDSVDTD